MSGLETPTVRPDPADGLALPRGGGHGERLVTAMLIVAVVFFSLVLGAIAAWNPLIAIALVAAAALGLAVIIRPELATMVTLFLVYASVPAVAVNSQDMPQALGVVVPFLLVIPAAYLLWRGKRSSAKNSVGRSTDLRVLTLSSVGVAAVFLLGNALIAQRKPLHASAAEATALVASIALNLVLVPLYGGLGAAIAAVLAFTIGGATVSVVFSKMLSVPMGELLPRGDEIPWLWRKVASI